MREIKFRAWDVDNHIMWYQKDNFHFLNTIWFLGQEQKTKEITIRNTTPLHYELMQYTGLKDKNGVEIYEGDILKQKCGIGSVVWDGIGYGVLFRDEKKAIPLFTEDKEVIGNIYENPELLEVQND